jgi:hypothetical protein
MDWRSRSLSEWSDEFEAEMRRICPGVTGLAVDASAGPPPLLSPPRLIALMRALPDNAGLAAFAAALYAAAPDESDGGGSGADAPGA